MVESESRATERTVLCLLFVSGFASLVYQVLWMRELELLFGSSAHATAGTLSVFFGGLAIGGAIWSRRAPRVQRPLAEYGLLEMGVGLLGTLYFGLMAAYAAVYSPLYDVIGDRPALLLAAKLFLAACALLPPAIFMGGTLPLAAQYIVGVRGSLGRTGTLLYGLNTLGAATGALAAGFFLPPWIGFRNTYLLAAIVSLIIGIIGWRLGRVAEPQASSLPEAAGLAESDGLSKKETKRARQRDRKTKAHEAAVALTAPRLVVTAIASGALALALEVLWTRMFQQVLQNSVYTFSIILVTFLVALALGAFLARRIARSQIDPWRALTLLVAAAGIGALVTPFLFFHLTDGMRYLGAGEQWSTYVVSVFSASVLVLLVPGVAVGAVFPYLLRVGEQSGEPGRVVGRLSALNTAGAIVGSLVTGFVMLRALGLWTSLLVIAVAYFVLAAWLAFAASRRLVLVPAACLILAFTAANPAELPGVRLNPETETMLASWEGPDGYVAVIERRGSRRIKINNFYALGSSGAVEHEQNQTLIPLLPHPSPKNIFFLGMGTGITAGTALRLPSEQVTVTELVPEVVTAAAEYFNEYASGLFSSPRARVLARDGRNELRGREEQYDAIMADLFIPWRAGVGNLYSRDHYEAARDRLRPGGVYVQWIPLYQVTEIEFWTITRTFLEAFPHVHVWRGDFYTNKPILALVGSVAPEPLDPTAIVRNGRYLRGDASVDPGVLLAVSMPFYAGNLSESREIVPPGPIHTDDDPVIEYQAPISHRNARAGRASWFIGTELTEFMDRLLAATPPDQDPYLSRLDAATRGFVSAGLSYHKGAVLHDLGRREEAQRHMDDFVSRLPFRVDFDTTGRGAAVVEESD
ncbi:MAG: fused MFS/spermidine synthase [Acidobacteriota bacterium]